MRFSWLTFYLLGLGSVAHAEVAYWGIVGVGRGNGVLGHSFLLIKDRSQPFLIGDVYQYNISGKNGQPVTPAEVVANTENLIFSLKRQKFLQIFNSYISAENRIVALYELNLSEGEVEALVKALRSDLENLEFSSDHQYGIFENCVTRPVELINAIVDKRRRIDYLGRTAVSVNAGSGLLASFRGSLLNRLPFFIANTLEKHPLSKGRVQLYESRTTRTARFFSSIKKDIAKISLDCGWARRTQKTLETYTAVFLTEPTKYALTPILRLVDSCSAARSTFAMTAMKLYQVLDDEHEAEKQVLYGLANPLVQR